MPRIQEFSSEDGEVGDHPAFMVYFKELYFYKVPGAGFNIFHGGIYFLGEGGLLDNSYGNLQEFLDPCLTPFYIRAGFHSFTYVSLFYLNVQSSLDDNVSFSHWVGGNRKRQYYRIK